MATIGKGMLSSVEQAFVAWDEIRAPLKTPAWEATLHQDLTIVTADEERFSSKTAVLP